MEKKLYMGIAVLSLIAIIVSGIIIVQENAREKAAVNSNPLLTGINNVCTITKSSCETVQTSIYGKTFGVENAYLGMGGFLLLLALVVLQLAFRRDVLKAMIIGGSFIGGIMSLRFLYLQAFVLGKYCIYCLVVDGVSILILVLGVIIATKALSAQKKGKKRLAKV